jgi:energy-coupling factor transport system ATP-binding protein
MGPRLLVLDEPSANLDPRATSELFALLKRLAADRRHTIVLIEHKLDESIDWIGSVLALDSEGRLLFRGDPGAAFYEHGAALSAAGVWHPQTVELVAGLRAAGWDVAGSPLGVEETVAALAGSAGLTDAMRRRHADAAGHAGGARAAGPYARGEALLSTKDLTFRYPNGRTGPASLSEVTMSLVRGGFLAIAGANGAGKSTLAALLTGVLESPRGSVFLEGRDIADMRGPAVSDRVGYVFQNPEHQFVSDTVLGELAYSLSPKAGRKGARHLTGPQRQLAEAWLERLGLLPLAEANPFTLSQGQKRRLSVAALLIRGQSGLVLDEPTLGQDESQADRLMAMMQEFRAAGGTVAMITHDMRLVSEHADSLLVLVDGRIVYEGSPAGFFSQSELVETSGLAVPTLGRVCAGLRRRAGTPEGLLTAQAFLSAAGAGPGVARVSGHRAASGGGDR